MEDEQDKEKELEMINESCFCCCYKTKLSFDLTVRTRGNEAERWGMLGNIILEWVELMVGERRRLLLSSINFQWKRVKGSKWDSSRLSKDTNRYSC